MHVKTMIELKVRGAKSFLFFITSLVVLTSSSASACPRSCFCNNQGRIIYCSRRNILAIPDGIPADSIELNLNNNHFQTPILRRSNFSNLDRLEKLYLSDCGIEWIQVDAFKDLVSLQWLDLSANRIRQIDDFTFAGITLQHLFLNGNRHIRLSTDSFAGLTTTGLYLHDCSLIHLSPDVLSPLNGTLRNLWLNGNGIERPSKRLHSMFASLAHLRLGTNPLHCNCETAWLKELFDSREELFQGSAAPSCYSPPRLKGKEFSLLTAHEFKCVAPVFNNIDTQFDHIRGRLRCTATGDPPPTLYWIRPSGEARRYSPPASPDLKSNEAILTIDNVHTDSLSGMYICIATNEGGNVTLTVNVSWPRMSGAAGLSYKVLPPEGLEPISVSSPSPGGLVVIAGLSTTRATAAAAAYANGNITTDDNDKMNNGKRRPGDISPNGEGGDDNGADDERQRSFGGVDSSDIEVTLNNNSSDSEEIVLHQEPSNRRRGLGRSSDERTFSLTEMVVAIVSTHVGTALLVALIVLLCRRRKRSASSLLRYSTTDKQRSKSSGAGRPLNSFNQYSYDR